MPLSKKEQAQLEALQEKAKAPAASDVNRSAIFSVDLGDETQVKRAAALGLLGDLGDDDDDDGKGGDDDDEEAADDQPRRGGYFKDGS